MANYGYVNTMRCMGTDVDALLATGVNTTTAIQNGFFVTLGDYQNTNGAVTEFVYDVTLAAASTKGNYVVRTPEVGTDILTQVYADPRMFINKAGQPMQLVYMIPGVDIIEVTAETLDQPAAKGDFYTLVGGQLTKGTQTTDATCFECLGTHTIEFGTEEATTYLMKCVAN